MGLTITEDIVKRYGDYMREVKGFNKKWYDPYAALADWRNNKEWMYERMGALRVSRTMPEVKCDETSRIDNKGVAANVVMPYPDSAVSLCMGPGYSPENARDIAGAWRVEADARRDALPFLLVPVAQDAFRKGRALPSEIRGCFNVLLSGARVTGQDVQVGSRTIKPGGKVPKVMRKMLEQWGVFDNEVVRESFDKWVNDLSIVGSSRGLSGRTVTFSIDPLDFLSLSDNSCGWTSCYALMGNGCYSESVGTCMRSAHVLVAYVTSEEKPEWRPGVPNKAWRCLCYVGKGFVAAGKGYPFHDNAVSDAVAKLLADVMGGECTIGPLDLSNEVDVRGDGLYNDVKEWAGHMGMYMSPKGCEGVIYVNDGDTECLCCGGWCDSEDGVAICHECAGYTCEECGQHAEEAYRVYGEWGDPEVVCGRCLRENMHYDGDACWWAPGKPELAGEEGFPECEEGVTRVA